jgi:hypothetical protein
MHLNNRQKHEPLLISINYSWLPNQSQLRLVQFNNYGGALTLTIVGTL